MRLCDVSLTAALLGMTTEKLLTDLNTMGLLFESLVIHDMKVYADQINAKIYHFRDNNPGDEIDLIAEYPDGEYGAIEIKLSTNQLSAAKVSLLKFNKYVHRKPKYMATIVGVGSAITKDQESGIYAIPFHTIGPISNQ